MIMVKFLRNAIFSALILSTFLLFSCGGEGTDDSNREPSGDSSQESGNNSGNNGNDSENGGGSSENGNTGSGENGSDEGEEEVVPQPFGVASFEDMTVGTKIGTDVLVTNGASFSFDEKCDGAVTVVKSPFGGGNALKFEKSDTEFGGTVAFYCDDDFGERAVLEFDLRIDDTLVSVPLQINLGTSYRLQFSTSLGHMFVNDATQDGKTVHYLGGYRSLGSKIHIRVEFYFGDSTSETSFAKVYFDGALAAISQNTYYAEPNNKHLNTTFYSLRPSTATIYIDNVSIFSDDVTFVDDGDEGVKRFLYGESYEDNQTAQNREILGEAGVSAMRDLESIFDERVYIWLANLYDPETGGFYYSNDARDYEGFLPDAESTAQALSLIQAIGLGRGQDYYTEEMAERVVAWVQSLQSEADGYFYHPQWGEDIPLGRRGRDYSWCTSLLDRFGAEPLYTLALDRISPVSLMMPLSDQRSAVVAVSINQIPENNSHIKSPEALIAYLDNLYKQCSTYDSNGKFVDLNSYTFCGTIGTTTKEIIAAGLTDVLIDYLNSKQHPDTGLWEKEVGYRAASGILKISGVYNSCERPFLYADRLADSMVEIIKSEKPLRESVYVYNPISGLVNVLTNVQKYGSGDNTLRVKVAEILRSSALDIISNTKNKIESFKRADGSFSYSYTGAPAVSAGVPVCYGRAEGDINGCGLVNSTITNLYTLFGMTRPPMFDDDDKEAFREILHNKKPVVKKTLGGKIIDFEGGGGLPAEVSVAISSEGSYGFVTEGKNTSLELSTTRGAGDTVRFISGERGGEGSSYVFSLDLTYLSANNTIVSQIFFTSRSSFALNIGFTGGLMYIQEHRNSGTRAVLISGVEAIGKTVHLDVIYYPQDKCADIILTVDGKTYTAKTDALFNEEYYADPLDTVRFYMLNSSVATVRLDNIDVYSVKK